MPSKSSFWLTFTNGRSACAWVASEADARALAAGKGHPPAVVVATLPYPAAPRIDDGDGWGADQCPSFCYEPRKCVGKTCCPQRRSCVE